MIRTDMSNFSKLTKHPLTGDWEMADWLDNYFGQHHYGVKFPSGEVFNADEKDLETKASPQQPSVDEILENEFEWSVRNNKTVRFHVIKAAIYNLLEGVAEPYSTTSEKIEGIEIEGGWVEAVPLDKIKEIFGNGEEKTL